MSAVLDAISIRPGDVFRFGAVFLAVWLVYLVPRLRVAALTPSLLLAAALRALPVSCGIGMAPLLLRLFRADVSVGLKALITVALLVTLVALTEVVRRLLKTLEPVSIPDVTFLGRGTAPVRKP